MSAESDYEVNHRDITSIMKDGMIVAVEKKGKDGKPEIEWRINDKSAWWKTHVINSPRFGLLAEALEDFATLINDCKYSMSAPRAAVVEKQLLGIVDVYRRSIDAKSSETMRDGRNAQTALVDKYLRNKQERVYDIKDGLKKSFLDGILGKESDKAADD